MTAKQQIQVFVVDDHPILRDGLRSLLGSTSDLRVAGESASARDAMVRLRGCAIDVVMLNLALEGEDGLEVLPMLMRAAPGARFLVFTGSADPTTYKEALRAGAHGFLTKDRPAELILKALRKVSAGELWFDRHCLESVLNESLEAARRADPELARIASLTPREREVAGLVAEGLRNDEIAERLGINEKTVRNHLSEVFEKLGVAGRLKLLVYALHHGLGAAPLPPNPASHRATVDPPGIGRTPRSWPPPAASR